MTYKKKLIEVALPLDAINRESAREKNIRHGHPSTMHLWWARRPLASARAVLWSSLVDDPSAHPDRFPTEEDQETERQRLFRILEELVKWENSNDEQIFAAARREIETSTDGHLPSILDPFCGGGTIPLEAQRLGLPAYGGDLNPVAVLISKALVEIPPRFAGLPPVHPPEGGDDSRLKTWERAQGLAEDIRYYGRWMREQAYERIGHLYPKATLPAEQGGGEATVIAWVWARTVESPDPSWTGHVPLVRSWILRKARKNKPVVWIQPVVDRDTGSIQYEIRKGGTPIEGTVGRSKGGVCVATGSPMDFNYIREYGRTSGLGVVPIATIVESPSGRQYLPPSSVTPVAQVPVLDGDLPLNPRDFKTPLYGMTQWGDLFTDRQLVGLDTFSDVLGEVWSVIEEDAEAAGYEVDGVRARDGGSAATAYADAITTYLAFGIDRLADIGNALCRWESSRTQVRNLFSRQAVPMVWDFAEANLFGGAAGDFGVSLESIARSVDRLPARGWAEVRQRDAAARMLEVSHPVVSTDPPYYDNISYADLSDFFYVWLRRNLRDVWPDEVSTVLTPKAEELIANPYRSGSKEAARAHFENGMEKVFSTVAGSQHPDFPATVFYAFKQTESDSRGTASTGWETFLQGLITAGFTITATWPMRTEQLNRPIAMGAAALASSIVIACRPRSVDAPLATRGEFLAALRLELPAAIRLLQKEAIAPVDMAQSAIGPGMAVFSRYSKVIEADGSEMSIRQALALINEVLEEVLSEEETEFDPYTRWALTWFEQNGMNPGLFGDANVLATAKNTSVGAVVHSGIAVQRDGKVRLLDREELDADWDPVTDALLTVWEVTQYLITHLDASEVEAGDLLRRVGGGMGDRARLLAYLLFQVADRKGWSAEAVAYNGLIQAWSEISKVAARDAGAEQQSFGE